MRKKLLWFFTDTLIFVFSITFLIWVKFGYLIHTDRIVLTSLYCFIIWTVISLFTKKQDIIQKTSVKDIISDLAISNVLIFGAILILSRLRPRFIELRFLLIYLVVLASFLEFIAGLFFAWYNRIKNKPFYAEQENGTDLIHKAGTISKTGTPFAIKPEIIPEQFQQTREALTRILIEETDEQVIHFIEKYIKQGLSCHLNNFDHPSV